MFGASITEPAAGAADARGRAAALCGLFASAFLLVFGISTNVWVRSGDALAVGPHGVSRPFRNMGLQLSERSAGGDLALAATYAIVTVLAALWMMSVARPGGAPRLARATLWLSTAALVGASALTADLWWQICGGDVAEGAMLYGAGCALAIACAARLRRPPDAGDLARARALG